MDNEIGTTEDAYEFINMKLWNPKRYLIMGLIFSFLPAAILYSINYYRLGNKKKCYKSVLLYTVLFVLICVLASYIEKDLANGLFLGINAFLVMNMQKEQKELFGKHIAFGGKAASYVLPIIISTVLSGIILWAAIYTANIPDNSIVFQDDELYYTERIEKINAEKLGKLLENNGLFVKDDVSVNVGIDKDGNIYIFSLLVKDAAVEDSNLITTLKELSYKISKEVFNNQKVQVNLCDNNFKVLKELK